MPTTPHSTTEALYAALNVEPFDRANIHTLFTPSARIHVAGPISHTNPEQFTWIVDEFLDRLSSTPLTNRREYELHHRTDLFGSIAHIFSTYELTYTDPAGTPTTRRGINSFQLIHNNSTWRIFSLIWDAERPDNPLPPKYLP